MDLQQAPPSRGNLTVLDRLTLLPVELQKQVLLEYLTVSKPPCALALFVPDWGVCAHASDPVNEIYDLQRIDVYIKGVAGAKGEFEFGVNHGDGDHASFPLMKQMEKSPPPHGQHDGASLREELDKRFPTAMEWALRDIGRNGLGGFEQIWPRGPDDEVGRRMAGGALVFREESGRERLRGRVVNRHPLTRAADWKSSMESPRHLMFNGFPSDPWLQLRLRRNALTNFRCEMEIVVERGSELRAVDWAAMTQLETLFLDLRTYARGGSLHRDGIRRGAARMGCLRLGCLVVAGLRTGERYVQSRSPGWRLCEWETDDEEVGGGVNWVKVFSPALGEGGRMVFVDQRVVDVDWDGWRVRAEGSGLLLPAVEEGLDGDRVSEAYLRHVDKVMGDGK
ncbi:hypothetical protein CORC01_12379 [Colletotrichum orchidophilum]|uniref:Uncharacterized protein n=1 Tax=Colletotrichum orchidophilum TaxID=1209926 RepID=A0A1G4AT26_9PEZI|nr:uncharacterized protein CORC01_12379 [Colletotrichum orchidophilum]OHE92317.1 hypothetical protein CORC01_12379 [Colletotrichum orchidophilum]